VRHESFMRDPISWVNEKRMIAELIPAKYNPRQASDKENQDLALSIDRFSLADPIIINRNNTVIGGHFRLRVLQSKGINEVDVRVPNRLLDEAEEKELNLRLNKNTGSWNFDLLADFGKDMLAGVGFESFDLDKIFSDSIKEDDFDAQKEYDAIKEPIAKYGDIYLLGEHRLMCGDATKQEDVVLLMDGALAQLIFTDPPYNVNYKSAAGLSYASKKYGGSEGKIFNDNKSNIECLQFYSAVLRNLHSFSKDNASIYWWYASKNEIINRLAFDVAGWHISQVLIWLKNGIVFSHGQDYHRCYEPALFGWKNDKSHFTNKRLSKYREVWDLDLSSFEELLDVWFQKRDAMADYVHPTQKPVRLSERALKKNTERGDVVIDLFGGSGSTLIACEQSERKACLMELDPKYIDVIVKRWELLTGKKAQCLNGKS
jgi:DNA modification methylase